LPGTAKKVKTIKRPMSKNTRNKRSKMKRRRRRRWRRRRRRRQGQGSCRTGRDSGSARGRGFDNIHD
jgi:hypothetical protein